MNRWQSKFYVPDLTETPKRETLCLKNILARKAGLTPTELSMKSTPEPCSSEGSSSGRSATIQAGLTSAGNGIPSHTSALSAERSGLASPSRIAGESRKTSSASTSPASTTTPAGTSQAPSSLITRSGYLRISRRKQLRGNSDSI